MTEDDKDDAMLLFLGFLVAIAAISSVAAQSRALGWLAILLADAYLGFILGCAAYRTDFDERERSSGALVRATFKDRHPSVVEFFPRRTAGVVLFAFLITSIVFGFAGLYIGTDVFATNTGWLDAVYISLQTLGFADFKPANEYGQLVVILQLLSGILLMVGAFPLLISRLSTFESSPPCNER